MEKLKKILVATLIITMFGGLTVALTACGENSSLNFARDIASHFEDTHVNMSGVTAFGVARADEPVSRTSAGNTPVSRDVLVSIDKDGTTIREVIFRTRDYQERTQNTIGYLRRVYVSVDFTFMRYDSSPHFSVFANHEGDGFVAQSNAQTFAIHHATGRVFNMQDFRPNQWFSFQIRNGILRTDNDWYSIGVDASHNMTFTHLNPNPQINISDALVDRHGRTFLLTNNLAEVTPNVTFLNSTQYRFAICENRTLFRISAPDLNFGALSNVLTAVHYMDEYGAWIVAPTDLSVILTTLNTSVSSSFIQRFSMVLHNGHLFTIRDGWWSNAELFLVNGYVFAMQRDAGLYHVDVNSFQAPTAVIYNLRPVSDISNRIATGQNAFWQRGNLILEIFGAMANQQYVVNFDGANVTLVPHELVTFQGRPVVSIRPIN